MCQFQLDLHDGRLGRPWLQAADPTARRDARAHGQTVRSDHRTADPLQLREGLSVLEYFISTHGARKGLADTALKTANSGYLTRRLVDIAQDVIVTERDCKTADGIEIDQLVEGGEVIERLGDRILGRVALNDIIDPVNGEVLVRANEEIDEDLVARIEEAGTERVMIRSVLTCVTLRGVCALCYGRDLALGKLVNDGEAVGVVAAQSIGEPGTQLTMRTFHIGGTGTLGVEQSHVEARTEGVIKYLNLSTIRDKRGVNVVMNRNGAVLVCDATGRERERYPVNYGAQMHVADEGAVKPGETIHEWDPFQNPILADVAGRVDFEDIKPRETMEEQVDEFTGLSNRVIIEPKDPELQPRIEIKTPDSGGKVLHRYLMPVKANLAVQEGDFVEPGDTLARIPRETTKNKDITGGLPRVAELFEARKPKEFAIVSEIDGTVSFGPDVRGKRRVIVTPETGGPAELRHSERQAHRRPRSRLRSGGGSPDERFVEPSRHPQDQGPERELAKYLLDEIQEVYRLQGVSINDKHIEVIIRQMLRWVVVKEVGDTEFLIGEQVEKHVFDRTNREMEAAEKQAALAEPLLLSITKASLSTRKLHFGSLVPGDDQGLDPSVDQWKDGSPARPEGERHHGSANPGRHGDAVLPEHGDPCGGSGRRDRGGSTARGTARGRPDHLARSRPHGWRRRPGQRRISGPLGSFDRPQCPQPTLSRRGRRRVVRRGC